MGIRKPEILISSVHLAPMSLPVRLGITVIGSGRIIDHPRIHRTSIHRHALRLFGTITAPAQLRASSH